MLEFVLDRLIRAGSLERGAGLARIGIDRQPEELFGERADIDRVAGKGFRAVWSVGVEHNFTATFETFPSELGLLRQEQRLDLLVDMGRDRVIVALAAFGAVTTGMFWDPINRVFTEVLSLF